MKRGFTFIPVWSASRNEYSSLTSGSSCAESPRRPDMSSSNTASNKRPKLTCSLVLSVSTRAVFRSGGVLSTRAFTKASNGQGPLAFWVSIGDRLILDVDWSFQLMCLIE